MAEHAEGCGITRGGRLAGRRGACATASSVPGRTTADLARVGEGQAGAKCGRVVHRVGQQALVEASGSTRVPVVRGASRPSRVDREYVHAIWQGAQLLRSEAQHALLAR